jgi:hypothetical protein
MTTSPADRADFFSLAPLALAWLEERAPEKPSDHTEAARRADLASLGRIIADQLKRPASAGTKTGGTKVPFFERELGRLVPADLTAQALRTALASFARRGHATDVRRGHAAASVRRVLSTWRGFCRWLVLTGELTADPTIGIKGPPRPDPTPSLSSSLSSQG